MKNHNFTFHPSIKKRAHALIKNWQQLLLELVMTCEICTNCSPNFDIDVKTEQKILEVSGSHCTPVPNLLVPNASPHETVV